MDLWSSKTPGSSMTDEVEERRDRTWRLLFRLGRVDLVRGMTGLAVARLSRSIAPVRPLTTALVALISSCVFAFQLAASPLGGLFPGSALTYSSRICCCSTVAVSSSTCLRRPSLTAVITFLMVSSGVFSFARRPASVRLATSPIVSDSMITRFIRHSPRTRIQVCFLSTRIRQLTARFNAILPGSAHKKTAGPIGPAVVNRLTVTRRPGSRIPFAACEQ